MNYITVVLPKLIDCFLAAFILCALGLLIAVIVFRGWVVDISERQMNGTEVEARHISGKEHR